MKVLTTLVAAAALSAVAAPALAAHCSCPPRKVAHHRHYVAPRPIAHQRHHAATRTIVRTRTVVVTRYVRVPVRYEAPPPPPPIYDDPPPPPPIYDREPIRYEHHARPPCRPGEGRRHHRHHGDWGRGADVYRY